MKNCACLLILLTTFCVARADVIDSVSVEAGPGEKSDIVKYGVQHNWFADSEMLSEHHLKSYLEVSVAKINEKEYQGVPGWTHTLTDYAITPALRWSSPSLHGVYLEAGIGATYMTDYYENRGRIASTRFQFGDHLGVGYQFASHFDLSLKFQHFSNADIKEPNPGINFIILKMTFPF